MNPNSLNQNMIQNMIFDDLPLRPGPLLRTHKAYCCHCGGMATSYDPMTRVLPCEFCKTITIPFIQKHVRAFLVRKKQKKLKQKESIHRWFMTRNIDGRDLSHEIYSFL